MIPSKRDVKIKTRYMDEVVNVFLQPYPADEKTMAILLADPETGETVSNPTCYIEGVPAGHVAVKDYSENEGMLHALIAAGIVGKPIGTISSGFVGMNICPLLVFAVADISEDKAVAESEDPAVHAITGYVVMLQVEEGVWEQSSTPLPTFSEAQEFIKNWHHDDEVGSLRIFAECDPAADVQ